MGNQCLLSKGPLDWTACHIYAEADWVSKPARASVKIPDDFFKLKCSVQNPQKSPMPFL